MRPQSARSSSPRRSQHALLAALLFVGLLLVADAGSAHNFALSKLIISPKGQEITFLFRLDPTSIVEQITGEALPAQASAEQKQSINNHVDLFWNYVKPRFGVKNDEQVCPLPDQPIKFFYNPSIDRAILTTKVQCPTEVNVLEIRSALFQDAPSPHEIVADLRYGGALERYFFNQNEQVAHINLKQLVPIDMSRHGWVKAQQGDGAAADASATALPPAKPSPVAQGGGFLKSFWGFLKHGIAHIFTGPDHILFVLCLVVAVVTWKELLGIVTSFTVAHSITLFLGAMSLVVLHPRIVEPIIALSIVYVGVENIIRKEPHKRYTVTFLFGLVHGFGFSEVLRGIGIEGWDFATALLGFNLGVEVGQLAIVAPVTPLVLYLQKKSDRGYLWTRRAVSGAGGFVALLWFIERVFAVEIVPFL